MIYVISGSSGVGKSTVSDAIMNKHPEIVTAKSYTTRPKRKGEGDLEYFHVDEDSFKSLLEMGEILEYTKYAGNYYGTSLLDMEKKLSEGKDMLLVLDINGGYAVKKAYPKDTILIYILAPSKETLRKRLLERGTEGIEKIEERLSLYEAELEGSKNYDYFVTNDNLDLTIEQVENIVKGSKEKK